MWRRRAALSALALWGLVSAARLSRLVETPEAPPGREIEPLLGFLKASIPADAAYLFVLPGEFGTDTGTGPRLRYELYPRRYDDIRATVGEASIRQLIERSGIDFVVVPDASWYTPDSWLRQSRAWLRRIELDADRYVLEVLR
jgi:hypothetical protein